MKPGEYYYQFGAPASRDTKGHIIEIYISTERYYAFESIPINVKFNYHNEDHPALFSTHGFRHFYDSPSRSTQSLEIFSKLEKLFEYLSLLCLQLVFSICVNKNLTLIWVAADEFTFHIYKPNKIFWMQISSHQISSENWMRQ